MSHQGIGSMSRSVIRAVCQIDVKSQVLVRLSKFDVRLLAAVCDMHVSSILDSCQLQPVRLMSACLLCVTALVESVSKAFRTG